MSIWNALKVGGVTIYILLLCSCISLAIIVERFLYFQKRQRVNRVDFMKGIREELAGRRGVEGAKLLCVQTFSPFSNVVLAGLNAKGCSEKEISDSMERQIVVETAGLEHLTSITGTIGSTAVYIGLFGTVLGIIRAFRDISSSNASGISVVVNGISEALVCTAAGLAVAIPAVIAFNWFSRQIEHFITDMELSASETLNLVSRK
jgi:biopolymer transport protein ExbB/TolQ